LEESAANRYSWNPVGESVELVVDITKEELERERKIYCDCGYLDEKNPKDQPEYTEETYIKEIDTFVHKHGWKKSQQA